MVEILKSFEQTAGRISPAVIIVPGIVVAAAGLIIWLGGLGVRRLSLALAALILGGIFVLSTAIHRPAVMVLSILAAMVAAMILPRLFTAILLAKLVGGILFIILAWHLLNNSFFNKDISQSTSARESINIVRSYGADLADNIKRAGQKMDLTRWLVVAVASLVVFASGLFFRNATGAITFSILGTTLIWIGLGVLLMFKGSRPVERIEHDALGFGFAAVGMVVFGSLEQYVLCRHADRKRKAKQHENEKNAEETKHNWRGE